MIECIKCGEVLVEGKAIENTYTGVGDFGDHDIMTVSAGGPGKLIDCLKCPSCGWSITKAQSNE